MKNLKKYISLNLISCIGNILFLFCIFTLIALLPMAIKFDSMPNPDTHFAVYGLFIFAYKYYMKCVFIEFVLFILFIFEFIIRKYSKIDYLKKDFNLRPWVKKVYTISFYLGLFFGMIPVCLFILWSVSIIRGL